MELLKQAFALSGRPHMAFEISIKLSDKGLIDEAELERRKQQFDEKELDLIVSRENLFYRKALLVKNSDFVKGFYTFVRVIDTKYYDNSEEKLKEILQIFRDREVRLYVGGRLNPVS